MEIYDIAIVGAGVAGAFATYKIAKEYKNAKLAVLDLGRPPMKRRRQLEGWLGCLPNSDGKLYLQNIEKISDVVGKRAAKKSYNQVEKILKNFNNFKLFQDKGPSVNFKNKITKSGYQIINNDYVQIFPRDIHALSKHMAEVINDNPNVNCFFDEEAISVSKSKKVFQIQTTERTIEARKVIFCVGRSGWRWSHQIYGKFGIIQSNNIAKYGIKIETDSSNLKELNKSSCHIIKPNKFELGPFSWGGSVIPEDHIDCAIASYRSNEERWKTDKVSFNLIGYREFENNGVEQNDRICKLSFLLANDRILKEKLTTILSKKSKLSIMNEYKWLIDVINEIGDIMPNVVNNSHFYFPTMIPETSEINIYANLETDVPNLYVAGESANLPGLLSAACTGILAAESALK